CFFFFFFFQAEDGIRDPLVTGVQTCALPISPDDLWMHADDNFVRSERPFEAHYFHASGNAELTLPAGQAEVEVMRGFEYRFEKRSEERRVGKEWRYRVAEKKCREKDERGVRE